MVVQNDRITLETILTVFFTKVNMHLPYDQKSPSWVFSLEIWELCLHKNLCLEMDKQTIVHPEMEYSARIRNKLLIHAIACLNQKLIDIC
jgi:hypothetical protein